MVQQLHICGLFGKWFILCKLGLPYHWKETSRLHVCEEVCRTSLFVMKVVLEGGSCFGASDSDQY